MKTIVIDGKEYVSKEECKRLQKLPASQNKDNPFMEIGKPYFIRTVTHYFTGRLIWVGDKEICLEDVCWIADTGRFSEFASGKTINESEPFPKGARVIIGRGSIIDMTEHELILSVK